MYSLVSILLLGFLVSSMGLPIEESFDLQDNDVREFNPQDFYASWREVNQESPGRIVGGWDASESDATHMVAIILGVIVKSLVCGACVINYATVLTAAHCIEPLIPWDNPGTLLSSVRGQVGSNLLSQGYQVVEFSHFLIHPDYDRWNIKSDVGILWLKDRLPKNSLAKPISISFKRVGGGHRLAVAGWGRLHAGGALPDRLQKLVVTSLSHAECKEGIQRARDEMGFAPDVDESVELCTSHPLGAGQGLCNGDSGSALWLEHPGKKRTVAGLVSWGFPCARGYPDVHGRISGFKDFIVLALKLSKYDYEE